MNSIRLHHVWPVTLALATLGGACVGHDAPRYDDCRVVGAPLPFTGSAAAAGSSIERTLPFAADQVNDQGGVAGQPVCVRSLDTTSELRVGMEAARALVKGEGAPPIVALFGPHHDDLVLRLVDLTSAYRVVGVTGSDTTPALTIAADDDLWFRTTPSAVSLGRALAERMYADGVRTMSVLFESSEYGAGWVSMVSAEFSLLGGTRAVGRSFRPEQASFLEDLRVVFADEVEAVVLVANPAAGAAIVTEWASAGLGRRWYLVPALNDEAFFGNVPPGVLDGAVLLTPLVDVNPDAIRSYAMAYSRRWNGDVVGPSSFFYFDALVTWALAAEYAAAAAPGWPDGAQVAAAMRVVANPPGEPVSFDDLARAFELVRAGQDVDYGGVSGPIEFDGAGDIVAGAAQFWHVAGDKLVFEAR